MAWLERDPSGIYHVAFRFGERKFRRSVRSRDHRRAEACCSRLEENIRLVEQGRLEIPGDADIPAFLSDGKLNGKPKAGKLIVLRDLFAEYRDNRRGSESR